MHPFIMQELLSLNVDVYTVANQNNYIITMQVNQQRMHVAICIATNSQVKIYTPPVAVYNYLSQEVYVRSYRRSNFRK